MSASYYGGWPGGPAGQINWLKAMQQPGMTAQADPSSPASYDPWATMQPYTADPALATTFGGGGQTASATDTPQAGWGAMTGQDANAQAWLDAKNTADPNAPAANYTPPAPGLTDTGFGAWLDQLKLGDASAPPQERRFGPIPEPIGGGPPGPGYDDPNRTPPTLPNGPASIGNDPGYVPPPPGGMPAPAPGGYQPPAGPAQTANWGDIYGQHPGAVNADIWGDVGLQNQFNYTGTQGYKEGFQNLGDTMADNGSVYNNWLRDPEQLNWALTQWDNFNAGNPGTSTWTDFLTGRPAEGIPGDDAAPTSPNMRQRLQDRYLQLPGWMQGMTRGNGGGFAGAMLGGYGGG